MTESNNQSEYLRHFGVFIKIYNGEFDPGSGWTLAAGLIHASWTDIAIY